MHPEHFGLIKEEEIQLSDLKEFSNLEDNDLPLVNATDLFTRLIVKRTRTNTQRLAENHIETLNQLKHEKDLIDLKQSKLSSSIRKIVLNQYNSIFN